MNNREAARVLRSWHTVLNEPLTTAVGIAIELLDPWVPPIATLPWVNVKDHPHPTDGTTFLAVYITGRQTDVVTLRPLITLDWVVYWCPFPKVSP